MPDHENDDTPAIAFEPALFPYQLSYEQYAAIIQAPKTWGYPVLPQGCVKQPKFGHIYVEMRAPGLRRPKLVDGLDWVPSSTANASSSILADGATKLLRYYCARRTKSDAAKPAVKPFTLFQRAVYQNVKREHPGETGQQIKSRVGERWRALSEMHRTPWQQQADVQNKEARKRLATADPSELLVRHEMCAAPSQARRRRARCAP